MIKTPIILYPILSFSKKQKSMRKDKELPLENPVVVFHKKYDLLESNLPEWQSKKLQGYKYLFLLKLKWFS